MSQQAKFRIIYMENCANISSKKHVFSGTFSTLAELKERLADFVPSHPSIDIEYYNKKFGLRNRVMLEEGDLPSDLESIYVFLRSKKPMTCHVCEARQTQTENHEH